jgi:peroxiredoxin
MSELRGLGPVAKAIQEKGGNLFAISVDPPERSADVVAKNRLTYSLLSDEQAVLLSELGIVHSGGSPSGGDIAHPAQFLFDRDGQLVWHYISRRTQQRVRPEDLVSRIQAL